MVVIKVLLWMLMFVALVFSLIIVIVGAIWILNEEFKELLGIDFIKTWLRRKYDKQSNNRG